MLFTRSRTKRPRGALLKPAIGLDRNMCRIGGRLRSWAARFGGVASEIPLSFRFDSNLCRNPVREQCQVGSLTGAVAS